MYAGLKFIKGVNMCEKYSCEEEKLLKDKFNKEFYIFFKDFDLLNNLDKVNSVNQFLDFSYEPENKIVNRNMLQIWKYKNPNGGGFYYPFYFKRAIDNSSVGIKVDFNTILGSGVDSVINGLTSGLLDISKAIGKEVLIAPSNSEDRGNVVFTDYVVATMKKRSDELKSGSLPVLAVTDDDKIKNGVFYT